MTWKVLVLSTPVGPLGSGLGGGVELTLVNLVQVLSQRGHQLQVVAPKHSAIAADVPLVEIDGSWQITAQTQGRETPAMLPANAVLANMWDYARQVQSQYDLILNLAYDWLPLYLTPFFAQPIAHFVSMGSLSEAMDEIVERTASQYPGTVGLYTQSQAETFPHPEQYCCLGSGVDLAQYQFCATPENQLAWVGRIAPEKGLEDAIAAAQKTGISLKIMGKLQDRDYWQQLNQHYPEAPIEYAGFLSTTDLQQQLGRCRALVMTPRWIEAFGNVAIEALACGVPVISYRRGGPAEIIQVGETGWLVEPDSVDGLVDAIARIDQIDRQRCRQQAEQVYSLEALGDRFEAWFTQILNRS